MNANEVKDIIEHLLERLPNDWLRLTTHRIDRFNEKLAKREFIEEFERLGKATLEQYENLPTAFDYIRLGHPLSCVLEWAIAKVNGLDSSSVISFSSEMMPLFAILRKNHFDGVKTRVLYNQSLPSNFNEKMIKEVYGYNFELQEVDQFSNIDKYSGSSVALTDFSFAWKSLNEENIDFMISLDAGLGSVIKVLNEEGEKYISEIQHVRRRESIAMTPHNCHNELLKYIGRDSVVDKMISRDSLNQSIKDITSTNSDPCLGSCGLSVQYAIMMGLIHYANDHFAHQKIEFIVPPNCYGGTNDQARRVAACLDHVEIVDLPVDSGKDMVKELERILKEAANNNSVPFIIAEIPTNPRVEIPDLLKLEKVLTEVRNTRDGKTAVSPVFILDQTFCPNVKFLGQGDFLEKPQTISYVSGSKFPSGGLCTAGYCVANDNATKYMSYIDKHLKLCTNEVTSFQLKTLTELMPSMNDRINKAYKNTRAFVNHIQSELPNAKINFVSHELADKGFTPSVFSLDLPASGESDEEREKNKRELNLRLIELMISSIPSESKYCVSYGQLKGCYWTIPATSTQGTTKEGDKDYIVRVSASGDMNVSKHKEVFSKFCSQYIN